MNMNTLKPWRELVEPHADVLNGTFRQAEFAVDISLIHSRKGRQEYQDPILFFQRTFITEGMSLLLNSVLKRLAHGDGDPVIQLQTAFGGGKTHTLLAVWHLVTSKCSPEDMLGVANILDKAGLTELPKANIAVIDGTKLSANQPTKYDSCIVNTLWGELAYQLGRKEAYSIISASDCSGTAPGKELIADILKQAAPCVVLMDELVAYLRQFSDRELSGGTFASNITFMQNLTEAMKMVPNAILLASLPESAREAGEGAGEKALATISHLFGRVQAIWKPVAKEEAFNIVRRRLFSKIIDQKQCDEVCRTFADFYLGNSSRFPQETQSIRYFEQLKNAYPIHPEVFARLYEDWSSLDNFQRTRGLLKLMARIIHKLWQDGNNDPLIMPGSLPLYDGDTRNDIIYYLPVGWDPVIDKDIDGSGSQSIELDTHDTRFGSIQACKRIARTIFLGSAPSKSINNNIINRGIEESDILLGSALPNHPLSIFHDALNRITEKFYYINTGNSKYWFDTRPNLRREMEERKRIFDIEKCLPFIKDILSQLLRNSGFDAVHVFVETSDVPDDENLRLIALKPTIHSVYSRIIKTDVLRIAEDYIQHRGTSPRSNQNRIIFIVADYDTTPRLIDHVKSYLAWYSIHDDYRLDKITLDNIQGKQARENAERAKDLAIHMIIEAYRWVIVPSVSLQIPTDIIWEKFQLQNAGNSSINKVLQNTLQENEIIIHRWAPIHMKNMLETYYWKSCDEERALKIWQDMCRYMYMARLRNRTVFTNTLFDGVKTKDNWAIAQGKENDQYSGFAYGSFAVPIVDSSTLVISKHIAQIYEEKVKQNKSVPITVISNTNTDKTYNRDTSKISQDENSNQQSISQTRYHAVARIDPIRAKMQLDDIAREIIVHLAKLDQTNIRIDIEINAETSLNGGFSIETQRTIKENTRELKNSIDFEISDFEN